MKVQPVVISLPIADRRTSYDFYRTALEFSPIGNWPTTACPSRCSSS